MASTISKSGLFLFLEVMLMADEQTKDKAKSGRKPSHPPPEEAKRIPLTRLHPFPEHPFSVVEDDAMTELIDSIKNNGVLTPAIVRRREEGGYEIVSGHRRFLAAQRAGLLTMPAIIRDLTRDEAIIMMVDSNLQRENILPCEKAKAYKMKLDAIKRQGERTDLTSCQVGTKLRSNAIVAAANEESARTVARYIRLTELTPQLQEMVDQKKMAITPAVEISYLKPEEQKLLLDTIDSEQATPSLSQAQRMKKLSQEGKLNEDTMLGIMIEQKKPERRDITLSDEKLRKYFPRNYTPAQIENTIFKLLDAWQHKRQQNKTR